LAARLSQESGRRCLSSRLVDWDEVAFAAKRCQIYLLDGASRILEAGRGDV
jgi:hypothetical protein